MTELAVVAYSEEMDYDRALIFFSKKCVQTLMPLLNGLFSVTIVTSVIQHTAGTIKPFFLTICPAACAWPATLIRTKDVEEDLEFCFNVTSFSGNSNQDHLKSLLSDARMSFPSFQEALLAFVVVFLAGYWRTKRIARALSSCDAIRLLSFSAMVVVLVLMSHSKMVRHKNWLSDIWSGIAIGVVLALHQTTGWHIAPSLRCSGQLNIQSHRKSGEAELKQVNIPRVTYRRSLVERRRNHFSRDDLHRGVTGTANPSFLFTSKQ